MPIYEHRAHLGFMHENSCLYWCYAAVASYKLKVKAEYIWGDAYLLALKSSSYTLACHVCYLELPCFSSYMFVKVRFHKDFFWKNLCNDICIRRGPPILATPQYKDFYQPPPHHRKKGRSRLMDGRSGGKPTTFVLHLFSFLFNQNFLKCTCM